MDLRSHSGLPFNDNLNIRKIEMTSKISVENPEQAINNVMILLHSNKSPYLKTQRACYW